MFGRSRRSFALIYVRTIARVRRRRSGIGRSCKIRVHVQSTGAESMSSRRRLPSPCGCLTGTWLWYCSYSRLCLYGCFSRPQAIVYRSAPPAVPEDVARVPAEVRHRGGLSAVLGSLPLAGRLCVSALRKAARVRVGRAQALAVYWLSASSFSDGGDDSA